MTNRVCPINIYDELLSRELPKHLKKRIKISVDNFNQENFDDVSKLLYYDLNIPQLKILNKKHNLKITGNKNQLLTQIYNYKLFSNISIKIQKNWRLFIRKKLNLLYGPALINRDLCVNDTDFFTLELCKNIPYENFISFKDDENYIYGFDIISIYNLYIKKKKKPLNPYTNKLLPNKIFNNLKTIILYNKFFKISLNVTLNHSDNILKTQEIEMKAVSLFQELDNLDNYTQVNWLLDLNRLSLIKLIRELYDIWSYRANLTEKVQKEIYPPYGIPFESININNISNLSYYSLLKNILIIFEKFIKYGINRESQVLGAYYVLSALTLVSNSAANALPWLYQSVLSSE